MQAKEMNSTMTRWGVGPLFAALSFVYAIVMIRVDSHFKPLFSLKFIPYSLLAVLGSTLIISGIIFLFLAATDMMRGYNEGKLITSGVYGLCRHPIYAVWAVFIVPGIMLFYNSWICLITPILMCITIKWLTRKEDNYLEHTFGADYIAYRKKTPAVLPIGWKMSKDDN